ncbi:hypothetical protein [Paracoccus lutimaris]|uniref:Uncharacterized protein n=1 Tax=Paracoccus lutimaris TaxID=1490030 RepID=A0A368YV94_9RHOB|nr:hypothetical protein [Paracoccus lutimaris]RCW84121.1 hypothetical protein DFP89_10865 [Paracoccus lutimaris]
MAEDQFSASRIGEVLADALEFATDDRDNLQHRVRYLAKKGHLKHGREVDGRGTLHFPKSEVYRAAILCEFLSLSMDMKIATEVLRKAERYNPIGEQPDSARIEGGGGYIYQGGLSTAVRGVASGEQWTLKLTLQRSGYMSDAGIAARYVSPRETSVDVDRLFGRARSATIVSIDLTALFEKIVPVVGKF